MFNIVLTLVLLQNQCKINKKQIKSNCEYYLRQFGECMLFKKKILYLFKYFELIESAKWQRRRKFILRKNQ